MGSTDYYSGTILARDLATIAIPVKELDQWKQWNMEERIQRDIAMQRIRSEIVPYLVNSPDRFFGSLIIPSTTSAWAVPLRPTPIIWASSVF
jgi:DNA sulfur modification protein DndB